MKYLKYINELNLNRDVSEVEITKTRKIGTFSGKRSIKYDNQFELDGKQFSCSFLEITENNIKYWERYYGYIEDDELMDLEMNLSVSNTLNIIQIITNITIDFLKTVSPDILLINHRDMYNETEVPNNKLNKRATINYRYLKPLIPSNYNISYWFNNFYQNAEVTASTACIIYKKNTDIKSLTTQRLKINI